MTGVVGVNPVFTFRNAISGGPLANGTVTVYVAGTTTPTNTWQDEALTSLNTNPISLDSAGRATIWFDPSIVYKFVVKNAGGVTQYTTDNIKGAEPSGILRALLAASSGSALVGFLQSGSGAVARTIQDKARDIVHVKDFGAVGDGVTDDTAAIRAALTYLTGLTGGVVQFGLGKNYLVSGLIRLPTNVLLRGNGATITVDQRNWTGGITHFYGIFSTVDITARPQEVLWRIGTGTVAYENIAIEGLTFAINRDGAVVSAGNMATAEFNVVRFEDARNCVVRNCRFIDTMTLANNNGGHAVFFVRSEFCEMTDCYAVNVTPLYIVESTNCAARRNNVPITVGTAFETVDGKGHKIEDNYIGVTWWAVSTIGLNSIHSKVRNNRIAEAALSGVTLGHSGSLGANYYSLSALASYAVCDGNTIEAGGTTTATHGYNGVLVQNASNVRITNNNIIGLRQKAAYTDRAGGVLVQPDATTDAVGILVAGNHIDTATDGVYVVRGEDISIRDNIIKNTLAGVQYELTSYAPRILVDGNAISLSGRAITINNGYGRITNNRFANITSGSFSVAVARGYFVVNGNTSSEMGEYFFQTVKSLQFVGNTIENAVVIARAATMDNSSTAGTATIDKIACHGNVYPGSTDLLRLSNVLGQVSPRLVITTAPTQFRTTSYNVGSLPTASAGLATGDLWSNAGVITVV